VQKAALKDHTTHIDWCFSQSNRKTKELCGEVCFDGPGRWVWAAIKVGRSYVGINRKSSKSGKLVGLLLYPHCAATLVASWSLLEGEA
jgi:hypothetical protein